MTPNDACAHVESWLAQPQVSLLHTGDRRASVLFDLLHDRRRLRALPGLRWRNPIGEA